MIFLLLLLKFLPLLNETNENIYFVERISQYICAPSDEIMIYYFDGDCAFCIDKLNLYSEKYKDNIIFIAKTNDPLVLKHATQEFFYCLFIDSDNFYEKHLKLNEINIIELIN
jgi:hypothetical protein